MVIHSSAAPLRSSRRQQGVLMTDMMVALGVVAIGLIPLAFSFVHEQKELRVDYYHAVAMEIVDGEIEILKAGEWKAFPAGTQAYEIKAAAAKNLPTGHFLFTRDPQRIRLEWQAEKPGQGGKITREFALPNPP